MNTNSKTYRVLQRGTHLAIVGLVTFGLSGCASMKNTFSNFPSFSKNEVETVYLDEEGHPIRVSLPEENKEATELAEKAADEAEQESTSFASKVSSKLPGWVTFWKKKPEEETVVEEASEVKTEALAENKTEQPATDKPESVDTPEAEAPQAQEQVATAKQEKLPASKVTPAIDPAANQKAPLISQVAASEKQSKPRIIRLPSVETPKITEQVVAKSFAKEEEPSAPQQELAKTEKVASPTETASVKTKPEEDSTPTKIALPEPEMIEEKVASKEEEVQPEVQTEEAPQLATQTETEPETDLGSLKIRTSSRRLAAHRFQPESDTSQSTNPIVALKPTIHKPEEEPTSRKRIPVNLAEPSSAEIAERTPATARTTELAGIPAQPVSQFQSVPTHPASLSMPGEGKPSHPEPASIMPAWRPETLLSKATQSYKTIRNYQTQVVWKTQPHSHATSEPQTVYLRYRKDPEAFHLGWHQDPQEGRQWLYEQAGSEILVREPTSFGRLSMRLSPDDPTFQADNLPSPEQWGVEAKIKLLEQALHTQDRQQLTVVYHGLKQREESTRPLHQVVMHQMGPYRETELYLDPDNYLPVMQIVKDRRGRELTYEYYRNLRTNVDALDQPLAFNADSVFRR
ncbi:Hypothetical protein PBC10988_14760 [Planctomycetales bacterium 10988]|nr:Hypothetical protein PBC10988_14760 [Planctomycetales bacterium 10988]